MSMFYELMMRKKEETLYPVIKGSLTESPSGVFSGFSTSNYLQINNSFQINNNYEVQVAFNYSSFVNQAIFSFDTGNISFLRLTDGGKLIFYLKFAYSQAQAVVIAPNTTLSANNNYIVKLKGSNGHHQMLLSSDNGASWELLGSVDYDFILNFSTFNFGVATYVYNVGFSGSIDLNNSYIKINSTKYNLQAVVGYTIVGSLTESPSGVFSGFSSANYLTLPTMNISEGTPFNIITKISTPADYQGNWLLAFVTSSSRIYCLSQAPVFRYLSNGTATNLSFNYTMVFNTTYILEVKYDRNKLKVIIYDENKNILSSNEVEDTKVVFFNGSYTIGSNRSNQFFNGSIDMNETDIKINNKLWFNGQQA